MDWIQCFAVYVAIISRHKPKWSADLLGYQSLIIGASRACREGKWAAYDRRFCLKASASHIDQWSAIDVTLWNTTFPERAIQNRQSPGSAPTHTLQTLLNGYNSNQSAWIGMKTLEMFSFPLSLQAHLLPMCPQSSSSGQRSQGLPLYVQAKGQVAKYPVITSLTLFC